MRHYNTLYSYRLGEVLHLAMTRRAALFLADPPEPPPPDPPEPAPVDPPEPAPDPTPEPPPQPEPIDPPDPQPPEPPVPQRRQAHRDQTPGIQGDRVDDRRRCRDPVGSQGRWQVA
jgi:outer membrane biosynthesis protein TonB